MVLWEIALTTAYFMGLPRTYRLALKIQRKLISPKHPRTHRFFHRRTRKVFNMALKGQRNIQEREIEVRRNLGNLFSSRVMWPRALPTIAAAMPLGNPMASLTRYIHLRTQQQFGRGNWGGVIRKDIAQWMLRK